MDARTLGYLLKIQSGKQGKLFLSFEQVRQSVTKVLNKKDFGANTYVEILENCVKIGLDQLRVDGTEIDERKNLQVREDLQFWLDTLKYVPRLDYRQIEQVEALQTCVKNLDDELMELDFSSLLSYLDDLKRHFMQV